MNDTSRTDHPHYTSDNQPDPLIEKNVVREVNAKNKSEKHSNDHKICFEQLLEGHLELHVGLQSVVHELNHFLASGLLINEDIPLMEFFKERAFAQFGVLLLNQRSR